MSTDDPDPSNDSDDTAVRDRIERSTARSVDDSLVDLLAWVLDTETRARIYIYLREQPRSTSDEIAAGTGLYPSTVREALAELTDERKVTRTKRESGGAGNNPYEYEAIAPSELVSSIAGEVQDELNAVFNLDELLADRESDTEPVSITVGGEDHEGDREAYADD
jgi:predicted transcriptional regulator